MRAYLETLRAAGLLDAGVMAVGLERGWVSASDVSEFAVEKLAEGLCPNDAMDLLIPDALEGRAMVSALWRWADREQLPTRTSDQAMRRWMFVMLKHIAESKTSDEARLDRIEDAYAMLDYPEEMRACSRYYVPEHDRVRGIEVGEWTESPIGAMKELLARLGKEFGVC